MKILVITPTFFPTRGGTEQVVYEIIKRYALKHEVTVLTPLVPGASIEESIGSVKIKRFATTKIPLWNVLYAQAKLYPILKKIIQTERPDVIHMFHLYHIGGVVIKLKKKFNIPLIITLAGWDTYDPIKPVPKMLHPYMAWMMNSAEIVTTMCQHMLTAALAQGCKKEIKILPHGARILPDSGLVLKQKYGISSSDKIVFSLQRLFPRKGLEYLIPAIALVVKQKPNVKFLIGGKGPELEKLLNLAKDLGVSDKVIFAGFISDDELKNYFTQSDLFVLPSLYEGFGMVYLEALVNGLPIVTTRCGGPEDIVTPDNGILVPVEDPSALAQAIITALDTKWDKQKIIADAGERYNWDKIVDDYERMIEEISK